MDSNPGGVLKRNLSASSHLLEIGWFRRNAGENAGWDGSPGAEPSLFYTSHPVPAVPAAIRRMGCRTGHARAGVLGRFSAWGPQQERVRMPRRDRCDGGIGRCCGDPMLLQASPLPCHGPKMKQGIPSEWNPLLSLHSSILQDRRFIPCWHRPARPEPESPPGRRASALPAPCSHPPGRSLEPAPALGPEPDAPPAPCRARNT